jgi:hypothetical protein
MASSPSNHTGGLGAITFIVRSIFVPATGDSAWEAEMEFLSCFEQRRRSSEYLADLWIYYSGFCVRAEGGRGSNDMGTIFRSIV